MQRFSRFLLAFSLIVIASGRLFAQDNLEQKIAEQQKLADEAHARKAAGDPAATTARTTAKERAAALAMLKVEQNKAEAAIRDADAKLPKLQEAIKKALDERTKFETESAAAAKRPHRMRRAKRPSRPKRINRRPPQRSWLLRRRHWTKP